MKRSRITLPVVVLLMLPAFALQAQDVVITGINSTPVTCGGGSDGTITVTVSGGSGTFTYLLVKGADPVESSGPIASTTYTFTGHEKANNYYVIVSSPGPGSDGFSLASIDGPEPISITSAQATDISCTGFDDGTLTVTATGEGGNYVFDLAGPVNASNETGIFPGLPAGDYTVTVSDRDGCPSTDITPVLTVNEPAPVTINIDNTTDVLCFGDNTGAISITPSGGSPSGSGTGYTYSWTGPGGFTSTSEDISNLEAGDYSVTVFDGNLCTAGAGPITLTQPSELQATLTGTTDVTCNGGNDGSASVTPSGGAGGYSYSWDGQFSGLISTDQNPANLLADTYDFTLFDSDGCSRTFISFAIIDEPPPLDVTVEGTVDESCPGGTDGSADITPLGGTPPYSFSWSGSVSGYTSTDEDPVDMPADSYDLTLTDANGCSLFFPDLLTIQEPDPIQVSVTGTGDVSCFGGDDGSADINVTGGTSPYTFTWTGSGTGHSSFQEDPVDLVADSYDLEVTDNNGCTRVFSDLLTISEPPELTVSVDGITDVVCNGESTGAIEITPGGGTSPYSFQWTGPGGFTSSAEDPVNLEAGSYSLVLTDDNGCFQEFPDLATVGTNTSITSIFDPINITCNGASDGIINASVTGGSPNYSYSWTGPGGFTAITEDISGLAPGSYQLTVTDDEGCVQVFPQVSLTEPPAITAAVSVTDIDCFGDNDGAVDLTPSGGTPPFAFAWTGPGGFTATTEDIASLAPGSYSVTLTDDNGCTVPFPDIATVAEPALLEATALSTDISCAGAADGEIALTVTGGTLPYSFAWTGPGGFVSGSRDLTGLEAGTYDLEITDGNGCTASYPGIGTVAEPAAINAVLVSRTDPTCNGESDGSAEIDVTGGTPPLVFDWTDADGNSVSSDEDPASLGAGIYSLAVTDASGCQVTYPSLVTLTEPPALVPVLTGTDITCYGDDNGEISVSVTGGTPPYEYSRLGDTDPAYQPDSVFSGLGPGTYTIWVRDAGLCVETGVIAITEPEEIQIIGETRSGQNLCAGDSLGQISIDSVTGGVMPYLYSINGGVDFSPDPVFTGLPAGNYQTVVRDASGCEAFGNLNVITEPSPLVISSYFQTDIASCSYADEGEIIIAAKGGKAGYLYSLNDTAEVNSTGNFQDLPAGTYLVGIEDKNGCTIDTSVEISAPPPLQIDNLAVTDVTGCSGDANGEISLAGSGGTGSISYSLDGGPFLPSGGFTGLSAGTYTLTIRDDNGCTLDSAVSVDEPDPVSIGSESVTPITCTGAGDGLIEVVASGGTPPFTYTLNPGGLSNATGQFAGLGPGSYTVTVDDAQGCGPASSSPLQLTDPPEFFYDSVQVDSLLCNGTADASLTLFASGGTPPYEYSVDNQATWSPDSLFTGLAAGTYELHVRDAFGCTLPGDTVILADPPALTASLSTVDVAGCAGDSTGSIEATGTGGTGDLAYSLDDITYRDTGVFTGLPAGAYTLFLRDANGCSVTYPVTVSEPDPVLAVVEKTDATFGSLGSITIGTASGGTPPYEYSIDGPSGTFSSETLYESLEAGTYPVVVRDANGCTYEELVEILAYVPLDVQIRVTDVSCFGAADGSIEFVPQDAEGAVEYSIDSGATFVPDALFESLPGDSTYYLVARDAAGKIFTGQATLTEPPGILLTANVSPAECNAFSPTGSINITASGGTGSLSFLWSDGSTSEDRANLDQGEYSLQTTDGNGCSRSDTFRVLNLVSVAADAGEDTTICPDAVIQLNGEGGAVYSWTPSEFLSDPTVKDPLVSGLSEETTFVLTVSEEMSPYGCYNIDSVTIDVYPRTGITVTGDTVLIRGASLPLEAIGGPFSAYRWEPATWLDDPTLPDPVATPLEPVLYTVYATNEFGCEESDSVWIDVIEELRAYNVFSPNGDGINDYFDIESADRFPEMVVEVYSRWGDLLFSSKGYDDSKRWDGTARGKDVPMGTYYYVIIPYNGARPVTGNVTIIR